MVKGLDKFREHFSDFKDRYALIGGTACDLLMDEAGLPFRVTTDLDIILCAEALDLPFAEAFWEFVKMGEYQNRGKATGGKEFYRFHKPLVEGFPFMLELCSRVPDAIKLIDGSRFTPLPIDEAVSSLSAIVLDEDYYAWVMTGKTEIEGVTIIKSEFLVPLKALAWLNLTAMKAAGESIDSKKIKKHKNDVFRLSQILDQEVFINVPASIKLNMTEFLDRVAKENTDLKTLRIKGQTVQGIFDNLRRLYGLGQ